MESPRSSSIRKAIFSNLPPNVSGTQGGRLRAVGKRRRRTKEESIRLRVRGSAGGKLESRPGELGWRWCARISRLKQSAEFSIYTPGSNAGIPVSILKSFAAPPAEVCEDNELMTERVSTTVTSLLGLLGIDGRPDQEPRAHSDFEHSEQGMVRWK